MRYYLMIALALCLSAAAALEIPRLSSPPVIDGNPDDPAWSGLKWEGGLKMLNDSGTPAKPETFFKLGHDGQNLYVLVKAMEPEPQKMARKYTERDSKIWKDDCIELFFDVNHEKTNYLHFVINANGALFDQEFVQGGALSLPQWNANGMKAAVKILDDCWIVEMAIPLVELGIEKIDQNLWGFNIGRSRRGIDGWARYSLAELSGVYHQPARFLDIKIADIDLKSFLLKTSQPVKETAVAEQQQLFYSAIVTGANETGKYVVAGVDVFLDGKPVQKSFFAADHGGRQDMELKVPVPENNRAYNLELNFFEYGTTRKIASKKYRIDVAYTPLKITMTAPHYRNNIYADQKIKALEGIVDAGIEASKLAGYTLKLVFSDAAGNELCKEELKAQKENKFSLPLPSLKDGEYHLRVSLEQDGRTEYENSVKIRKLPPFKGEVRLAENRTLLVDGKPFLPYGWFSITRKDEFLRLAKLGVTVTVAYDRSNQKNALDRFAGTGIRAVVFCYPSPEMWKTASRGLQLTDDEAKAIRANIRSLKDHPTLLAWYIYDEPDLNSVSVERLKAVKAICEEEDPYHPTIILNNVASGISEYIECGDITDPDPYPMFLRGKKASRSIDMVGEHAAIAVKAAAGRKGVWITPQGFNYEDFGVNNNRAPEFDELRNMQYQALIEGVTGFTWYSWHWAQPYPELMEGVDYLTREAVLLKELLLAPEKRQTLETGNKYLRAVFYPNISGDDFLIAVSTSVKSEKLALRMPVKSNREWFVVGTGSPLEVRDGRIDVTMPGYGTLIASNNRELANRLSLEACRRKIEEEKRKIQEKGNLLNPKDTKFTVSENARKQYPLYHLADGFTRIPGWTTTSKQADKWVQFEMEPPVTATRIAVYGRNMPAILLQVNENGNWREIAKLKGDSAFLEARFPGATAGKWRLLLPACKDAMIHEVELYSE